jgi:NHLM bacteriocin system ABC transporter ATP-binding protein
LRDALITRARQAGTSRAVAGNTPFLIDDPARCVVVLRGEVDLFLVPLEEGRPVGLRQHLFSLGEGGLLFGVDSATALPPAGLLVVGQVGTVVAELDLATLRGWAAEPALAPCLAGALEDWVNGLSAAMTRPILPRPRLEDMLHPGEARDLPAGRRMGCTRGVAWLAPGPPALFLDTGEVEPGETLPLAAGAWMERTEPSRLASRDTEAALRDGPAWAGLGTLHRLLLDILPLNLRLAAADEANRLRLRAEANHEAGRAALDRLAEPLDVAARFRPPIEDDDPLVRAAAAVAGAMGAALVPPPRRREHGMTLPITLDDIARANHLRIRMVRLEDGWWRADAGPLLVLREGDGRPLALLPRSVRGGWRLFDPMEGRVRLLSGKDCAALRGAAFSLTIPLPSRPLGGRDIGGGLLRWSRGDAAAAVGLGIAAGVLNLGVPIATAFLVNDVIPASNLPKLVEMGIVLLLLTGVMLLLRLAVQVAALRIEGRAGTRIQEAIMDRLLRLPMGFFRDYTAGNLAKRVLAIQVIEQALGGAMVASLLTGALALLSLGLMAWYSPALALVALTVLLLLAGTTLLLGWLRIRYERNVVAVGGESAGLLLQFATGIGKLRLAAAEDRAFLLWARLQARLSRQRFLAEQVGNLSDAVGMLALPLGTAAIFGMVHAMGMQKAGATGLELGLQLAFLNAFSQSMAGITGLATTMVQIAALKPVYAFAKPVLQAVPETGGNKADPGTLTGALEISHLSFRYGADGPRLLDDLSIQIAAGEYVAIVGPSGSGKSTLLRLMLGFEVPNSGAILYDGQDLRGLDPQRLRRQFGVVLQSGRLMPGTLIENILGANLHLGQEEAWSAAEQVGLAEEIRAMPMGMQTFISDGGSTLSGGQLQRVLLARAVVARPRILLLDEATSALDNRTQSIVISSLDRLNATRIVIAHRLSTVVNADRILVLKDGRVQESGTYAELISDGGFFCELAERQLV